jgi:hypothetical protein
VLLGLTFNIKKIEQFLKKKLIYWYLYWMNIIF